MFIHTGCVLTLLLLLPSEWKREGWVNFQTVVSVYEACCS